MKRKILVIMLVLALFCTGCKGKEVVGPPEMDRIVLSE